MASAGEKTQKVHNPRMRARKDIPMSGEVEVFERSKAGKRARCLRMAILVVVSAGIFVVFSRIVLVMGYYEPNSAVVTALQAVVAGGFFLLAAAPLLCALHLATRVRSIALGQDNLLGKTLFSATTVRYADINPIASMRATMDQPVPRKSLVLADKNGKLLLAIPCGFSSFAAMGEKVFSRAGEQAVMVERILAAPENGEGRSSRRNISIGLGAAALLFFAAAGVLGLEERGARMLEAQGRTAQGVVTKRYVDKDRYRRITYSFETRGGEQIIRDASLSDRQWESLAEGTHITVKYMRTYPEYNRIQGERDAAMIWLIIIALCLAVTCVLSLLFLSSGWRVRALLYRSHFGFR